MSLKHSGSQVDQLELQCSRGAGVAVDVNKRKSWHPTIYKKAPGLVFMKIQSVSKIRNGGALQLDARAGETRHRRLRL